MSFQNQADIVLKARVALCKSQLEVSRSLGYSSPQFISNIERELCGIPEKDLIKFSKILKIDRKDLFAAVMNDHTVRIAKALGIQS